MAREQSCLTVPIVTLTANELSETMGVACWGWSISINVVQIVTEFWPLANKVPSYVSISGDITLRMMENST